MDRSFPVADPDAARQATAERILRRAAKYVAILDQRERFRELVDRTTAVEQMVRHILDHQDAGTSG